MQQQKRYGRPSHHNGAIMLLTLVFLLLLAVVATTVMQTAVLQLHMAGNHQFAEAALQRAQAIVSELTEQSQNFSSEGSAGITGCSNPGATPGCEVVLHAPLTGNASAGVVVDYRIVRQDPSILHSFDLREPEASASSVKGVGAALFEVDVRVDGSDNKLGRARVVRGVALRLPALH